MLLPWMMMACVFTLCVAVAAFAVDRLLYAQRRSTRGVWATALAMAVLWPLVVPIVRPLLWPEQASVLVAPLDGGALAPAIGAGLDVQSVSWIERAAQTLSTLPLVVERETLALVDRAPWLVSALLLVWALMSSVLVVRLLLASRRIHALTRSATRTTVDEHDVLLAEGFGPASVGVRAPRIVLPQWVLALDAPLRSLVLRHEREHCESGDPRFVWSAALATALMPWNPGVWWLSRRLRLALELDCDVRTLQHGGDPLVYAKLLLFMTQQHAAPASHLRLASSLAASRSHLSRRIVAMQQGVTKSSRTVRFALGGAAVLAIAAACGTKIPGNALAPEPQNQTAAVQTRTDSAQPAFVVTAAVEPKPYFEFQVERPVSMITGGKMQYPPMLRSAQVEGAVLASFVVDEQGVVDQSTFKVLKSDHELFTNSVREALPHFTYTPAEVGGKRVKQLVQQPFVFNLGERGAGVENEVSKARRERELQLVAAGDTALPIRRVAPSAEILQARREREIAVKAASESELPRTPSDPTKPYFEFQVEKPAAMRPGMSAMVYPPMLRSAQVEGTVLASFVVDTNGDVDMSTFKVLKSDHELFTHAVKTALPSIKYLPAEVGGRKVKQLLQQPFVFSLAR
jgi:TonB family protein